MTNASATQSDTSLPRRAPERHKQELITATLELIAELGIPETTVSRIIERARLSRGMIHLHFGGKDKLLIAAAQSFSQEYVAEMKRQLADLEGSPAQVIMAVIRTDLSDALLNERAARLWHAFRGITNPDPAIYQCCCTRDGLVKDRINAAFLALGMQDGVADAKVLARDATFGTQALLEGMCVDYLSNRDVFSRHEAYRIVLRFVAGLFPAHFEVPLTGSFPASDL